MASRAKVSYILVPGCQDARYLGSSQRDIWQRGSVVSEPSWQLGSSISRLARVSHRSIVTSRHLTSGIENVDLLTFLVSWNIVKVLQIIEFRGIVAVWQHDVKNHGFG